MRNYRAFAWFTLAFNVLVILWGAFVRATGSGAGCGDHWPLCNGQVNPLGNARINTMIEFGHRTTSGLALIFVIVLFVLTLRRFPKGSFARRAAGYSLIAIFIEALVGAGIVLLRLVEHDQSVDRAVSIAIHLVNTLFLVGALTLTALAASEKTPRWKWPERESTDRFWALGLIASFAALGAMGALTALGDTLFPAITFTQELKEKFDPEMRRHFLQNIRVFHPILAVCWVGALWAWLSNLWLKEPSIRARSSWLLWLAAAQLAVGATNVLMLAPIGLQILHLLWANVLWILFVSIVFSAASRWQPGAFSGISESTP